MAVPVSGVYAAYTGPVSWDAALWAAVLRCGPQAALSHFSAAELDGLVDRPRDAIHVTIPASKRVWISDREFDHDRPRIVVHRSDRLPSARHPARTPPRTRPEETVLDLVSMSETLDAAFSWLATACGRRLVTPDQLLAAVASRSRMRWRTDVLIAVGEISDGILSHLERRYLRMVERPHGLPRPQRQARMANGGRSAYLDNLYGDFGLDVELDGAAWHPAESRWQDIRRDNALAGSGIITLRYSWVDV
ncbi:MAG TPA: hypothetical protein VF834_01355, partial [Streptosporangiaceae bacterium]